MGELWRKLEDAILRHPASWLFVAAMLFYLANMAPSTFWVDSAQLQVRSLEGWEFTPDARRYFLFTVVCRLVAGLWTGLGGDYAYGCNLVTGLFGAAAVALVFKVIRTLGCGRVASLAGSLSLMVAHTYWQSSIATEVYTLYCAALLAMLWAVMSWDEQHPRRLYVALFFCGIGIAHHRLALLALPAFALYVYLRRSELSRKDFLPGLLALLAGSAPVLAAAAAYLADGHSLLDLMNTYLFSDLVWRYVMLGHGHMPVYQGLGLFFLFVNYNFMGAALPLGILGAIGVIRRAPRKAILLWGVLLPAIVFGAVYNVEDKWIFFFPVYVVFAVFVGEGTGVGMDWIHGRREEWWRGSALLLLSILVLVPVATYWAVPSAFNSYEINLVRRANYTDYQRWFFFPSLRRSERPTTYARRVLSNTPPDAVLMADFAAYSVLRYVTLAEKRDDTHELQFLGFTDANHLTDRFAEIPKETPIYIALWPYHKEFSGQEVMRFGDPVENDLPLYRMRRSAVDGSPEER